MKKREVLFSGYPAIRTILGGIKSADTNHAIWSYLDVVGDCWEWTRCRKPSGYGYTYEEGEYWIASRLAYKVAYGEFDRNMHVLHQCDNPPCCNPLHLRLGTDRDNTEDKMMRGRHKPMVGEEHPLAKLSEDDVRCIRMRYQEGDISMSRLGVEFGVSKSTVNGILRGDRWTHVQ